MAPPFKEVEFDILYGTGISKEGELVEDTIGLRTETLPGEALLKRVMLGGERVGGPEALEALRERFRSEFSCLGEAHKSIKNPEHYPVRLSPGLEAAQSRTVREVKKRELGESS